MISNKLHWNWKRSKRKKRNKAHRQHTKRQQRKNLNSNEGTKISMSGRDMKVMKPKAFTHSNEVWRKKSFNSWIHLSSPSKVHVFLSLHMTHIRKWGIILQSNLVSSLQLLPNQLAIRSTTPSWHDPVIPWQITNCLK